MKKANYKPELLIIPYQLIEDKTLQPADKMVYGVIYYFEKMKDGICKASNKRLAEFAKHQEGTIRNSLSRLNNLGYITIYYEDELKNIRNRIECNVIFQDKRKTSKEGGCNEIMTGVSSNDDRGVSSNDAQMNKSNTINKSDNIAKQSFAGSDINEILNLFYEINPGLNFGNKTQRDALETLLNKFGKEKIKRTVEYALSVQGEKYAPVITTPVQLKNKLGDLKVYYDKNNNSSLIVDL